MIDLHSHILPGIDDGARTLEDSLEIARAAVADGITVIAGRRMCATTGRRTRATMEYLVAELRAELEQAGIALDVRPGGEIAIEWLDRLSDRGAPPLRARRQPALPARRVAVLRLAARSRRQSVLARAPGSRRCSPTRSGTPKCRRSRTARPARRAGRARAGHGGVASTAGSAAAPRSAALTLDPAGSRPPARERRAPRLGARESGWPAAAAAVGDADRSPPG